MSYRFKTIGQLCCRYCLLSLSHYLTPELIISSVLQMSGRPHRHQSLKFAWKSHNQNSSHISQVPRSWRTVLYSHAIPSSQISMHKLEVRQVGHAFSNLDAKVHQVLHCRVLEKRNQSLIRFNSFEKERQFEIDKRINLWRLKILDCQNWLSYSASDEI